jgi:hypothetical protein
MRGLLYAVAVYHLWMCCQFFTYECAASASLKDGSRICVEVRAKINIPSATENRIPVIQSLSHCTGWATPGNILQVYRKYVFFLFFTFYLKPEVFRGMTLRHGRAVSGVSKENTWVFRNIVKGTSYLVQLYFFNHWRLMCFRCQWWRVSIFTYSILYTFRSRLEYVATILLLCLDSLSNIFSLLSVSWYVGATAWNTCVAI